MSYILDALRKAERDRNLGRPPSLGDVTANPPGSAPRATSRRTWLLLALVIGLALLTVLLWPREPRMPPPVTVAPPAPATAPAPAAAEPAPEVTAPVSQAEPPPAAIDETVAAGSLDDLLGDTDETMVDETDALDARDPGTVPEPPVEATPPLPMPADALGVEPVPAPAPGPEPAPMPASPPVLPPTADAVTPLREMPSDYRAAFPQLRVDVHVYDADPARRWALVNGRKLVEGSTLAEGPRLVEITAQGLVFDFRGRSTLLSLDRGN